MKKVILLFIAHSCLSTNTDLTMNHLTPKEKYILYLKATANGTLAAGSVALAVYTLFQVSTQDPLVSYGFLLLSTKGIWDHAKPTYDNVKQLWIGKSKKLSPAQIHNVLGVAAKQAVAEAVNASALDVSITTDPSTCGTTTVPATIHLKAPTNRSQEDNFSDYLKQGNQALEQNNGK